MDWKEWAKDFGNSMVGRPNPDRNMPDVAVRPVSVITADLVKIQEDHWWKYAFSREPLNEKFDDAGRKKLMQQAIECGRKYADECTQKYGTSDAKTLAEAVGLSVDYPEQPQNGRRVLFAEYRDPNVVHIYEDGVRRGKAMLEKEDVKKSLGEIDLENILLSHELFHWIEKENENTIWSRTYELELWKVGPLKNRTHIACLSEIAAMSFAKRLNQLPYSAYVLDAFLDYGYSPKAASALYEEMMADDNRSPSRTAVKKTAEEAEKEDKNVRS